VPLSQTDKIPALTPDHKRYFIEKLGLSERLMERCLGEALSAGGDYADLYFESVTSTSLGIDESLVKSASQGISVGCGIRVLSGERTGYAYTDDLSSARLLRAARTAALIASGPAKQPVAGFRHTSGKPTLYPIAGATADAEIAAKLSLIQRADKAARDFDPRITQVRAGFSDELRRILIAASDGTFASDTQPLARLNVFVIAQDATADNGAGSTTRGTSGGGGRVTLDFFEGAHSPEHFAREAARTAILQLPSFSAQDGPAYCCTRPSATVSKPTSTARKPPPSPGSSARRSPAIRSPSSTMAACPIAAVPSTWTTRATPPRRPYSSRTESSAAISPTSSPAASWARQTPAPAAARVTTTSPCRA
jgi:TldD protein